MFVVSRSGGLASEGGRRNGRFRASLTELINQFCGGRGLSFGGRRRNGRFLGEVNEPVPAAVVRNGLNSVKFCLFPVLLDFAHDVSYFHEG